MGWNLKQTVQTIFVLSRGKNQSKLVVATKFANHCMLLIKIKRDDRAIDGTIPHSFVQVPHAEPIILIVSIVNTDSALLDLLRM